MNCPDLLIVGASYAGLSCARTAARNGLSVRVIEAKPTVGYKPHTTGILVQEATEFLPPIPTHLVRPIEGIRLYSPSLNHFDLHSSGYSFLAADTTGLLQWMADDVTQDRGISLHTGMRFSGDTHGAKFVVGADGSRSAVAKHYSLGVNKHFLIGMELEFQGTHFFDERFMHVFVDSELAPGYIAWAVPGVGITQVGLACKHPNHLAIEQLLHKLKPIVDLTQVKPLERRGGLIPAGGVVSPLGNSKALLIGDAAGTVSPLTAGGIHKALELGALAGSRIADYIEGMGEQPDIAMRAHAPSYTFKRHLRRIANVGVPNAIVEPIFTNSLFRRFAQLIFFHHRGLLSPAAWRDLR